MEDVFAIQDEIARAIVRALRLQAPGRQRRDARSSRHRRPRGLQALPQGPPVWNRRTEGGLRRAMRLLPGGARRATRSSRWPTPAWPTPRRCWASTRALPPEEAFPKAKRRGAHGAGAGPGAGRGASRAGVRRRCITTGIGPRRRGVPPRDRAAPGLRHGAPVVRQLLVGARAVRRVARGVERAMALDPLSALKYRRWDGATTSRAGTSGEWRSAGGEWVGAGQRGGARVADARLLATEHLMTRSMRRRRRRGWLGIGVSSLGALGHRYAVAGRTAQARQVLDHLLDLSDTGMCRSTIWR